MLTLNDCHSNLTTSSMGHKSGRTKRVWVDTESIDETSLFYLHWWQDPLGSDQIDDHENLAAGTGE